MENISYLTSYAKEVFTRMLLEVNALNPLHICFITENIWMFFIHNFTVEIPN